MSKFEIKHVKAWSLNDDEYLFIQVKDMFSVECLRKVLIKMLGEEKMSRVLIHTGSLSFKKLKLENPIDNILLKD